MARFEKSRCWFAAALLATTLFFSCNSGSNTAQGGGGSGANEQYKVLLLPSMRLDAQGAQAVETLLNDHAKQGWKVRTTISNDYIIFAR